MIIPLCPENTEAAAQLRPEKNDRSGIGVHYVDAYLKPLKAGIALPDGTKLSAKRRGLKVTITWGTRKGEGLMRRLDVSSDPVIMLQRALHEASGKLGARLYAENGQLQFEIPNA